MADAQGVLFSNSANKNNSERDSLQSSPSLSSLTATQRAAGPQIKALIQKTHDKLFTVTSVFPFDFFPDRLKIDLNKVDILYYDFLMNKRVFTILVENILSVGIFIGPFFATLTLEVIGPQMNPEPIKYLKIHDAIRARRMIIGLCECAKSKVDLSGLTVEDARNKVEEMGKADILES